MGPLSETWKIHNNINLYLLEGIKDEYLMDTSLSKGRSVGEQFAHMHNVRLMWLKVAAPDLLNGLIKIEKEQVTKSLLASGLKLSGFAIAHLFDKTPADGKIKGFKPHATAFLGYLISHESHHRGQIMLSLKQSGHMVDQKIQYGIWEWGNKAGEPAAGYSGTSLAQKLGIKQGFHIQLVNPPENYHDLFNDLPNDVTFAADGDSHKKDLVHFFTKQAGEYFAVLPLLKNQIKTNGMIWVSWPKKASKVDTDITEDAIRNYALKSGLIDIKVCAVDDTWSGLKLVIPLSERSVKG